MRASPLQISQMLACVLLSLAAMPSHAAGVVISQVYGGGGNSGATLKNDFIELFNAGASAVSLNGWSVQYASAAGSTWAVTVLPNVTLQPGQYFLVKEAAGTGGTVSLVADATGSIAMSASNGKVALVSGTAALSGAIPVSPNLMDAVAFGTASAVEGSPTAALNNTTAALRNSAGCTDTNSNAADFMIGAPAPRNSATPLSPCGGGVVNAPVVAVCGSLTVDSGIGGSLALSASDADSLVDQVAIVSAPIAGITLSALAPAAIDGAAASVSLLVDGSVPAGSYPVEVRFANNEAQSATCTANISVQAPAALTPIHQIQGAGSVSPLSGAVVTTSGVVTAVFPNLKGYYLQDASGDGDAATSDGIFVYVGATPTVNVGDSLKLQATVTEYFGVTELTAPTNVILMSTGNSVVPTPVNLPETVNGELERYEGMLVEIVSPMTVAQNYFQGRYGQVTLSAGGRLFKPTNVHRPNSAAALDMAQDNARRVLILDDGSSLQNPNPIPYIGADDTSRAGDTVTHLVGVIDYGLITSSNPGPTDYKLHPTQPPVFSRDNPRTPAPEAVGGNIRVAGANLLNYFTTISSGACYPSNTSADCRGADTATELQRQRDKMLAALAAINADVFGFMELENNGDTAVQDVVNRLNTLLGAGTYAVVPKPAAAGSTGTDAIRVGMIYKPGKLSLAGPSLSDTDAINNRPPLAQTFVAANGEKFSVVVNHLKSKGCSGAAGADLDQGDGQGCYNDRRKQQADRLIQHFIPLIKSTSGDNDVLVIGDLNAYGMEDPVDMLTGSGFVNQAAKHIPDHYSYVFDGESGALDHVLASTSLDAQVAGIAEWHINADEPSVIDYNTEFKPQDLYSPTPYRASDHDPVVIGLDLVKKFNGTSGRDTLTGTAGDDAIAGGPGADTLTGGAGRDRFVYNSVLDGVDTITDFQAGSDMLVMSTLLQTLGIASANPLAEGFVTCSVSGSSAVIGIDADGAAGTARSRALVLVRNTGCAALAQPANFAF